MYDELPSVYILQKDTQQKSRKIVNFIPPYASSLILDFFN